MSKSHLIFDGGNLMISTKINRRDFIKKSGKITAATSITLGAPSLILGKSNSVPPNVIFIICDQMRGDAMGCVGNPNARTPKLDKMAAEGALCENFFANNPVCVPSRISLFRGQYPHQHGQLTNRSKKIISSIDDTMLDHFRKRGYRLGWIGKNHTYTKDILASLETWENRAREPFRRYNEFVPPFWHSDTLWPEEKCHPRLNTDGAIKFINQAKKNEPFFLHVSYFDPHPPYMAPSEFTSKYCASDMKMPPFVHPGKLNPRIEEHWRALHYDKMTDTDLLETMRYYYASVEWGVDFQVGRILEALAKKNLTENTIVIFTSDHGDFMGEHRMVRKGMFLYDALLHVPLICYAPGIIKKGMRVKNLSQHVDIFPTLIDMTGGSSGDDFPGRSLLPFLNGETKEDKDFAIMASAMYSDLPPNYFNNPELPYNPNSERPFHSRVEDLTWNDEQRTIMVRTPDWKFIQNESHPPELYHMAGGFVEKENVADKKEHSNIRKTLENKVKSEWKW
jgi:arylsulfatase A-like enzyme